MNKALTNFAAKAALATGLMASPVQAEENWETKTHETMLEHCAPIAHSVIDGNTFTSVEKINNCADAYWHNVYYYVNESRGAGLGGIFSPLNTGYCSQFNFISKPNRNLVYQLQGARDKANGIAQNGFGCLYTMQENYARDLGTMFDPVKYHTTLAMAYCLAASSEVLEGRAQQIEINGCRDNLKGIIEEFSRPTTIKPSGTSL